MTGHASLDGCAVGLASDRTSGRTYACSRADAGCRRTRAETGVTLGLTVTTALIEPR